MNQAVLVALILSLTAVNSSIFSKFKENEHFLDNENTQTSAEDIKVARSKANLIRSLKTKKYSDEHLPALPKIPKYEMQKLGRDLNLPWGRNGRRKAYSNDESDSVSSSSIEGQNWKDEWKEHWLMKKLEAINSTLPKGDTVNMVAARPWGVPCGDPNQHDSPWGSCMLPLECEAEYRIYRGDYFCGRTKFICCALLVSNYDLNAGFDVSFTASSLATSSDEKKNRDRGTKESNRRKKRRDQKRRRRQRIKRKRAIKRTIRKIINEITKILNRSFRNGTSARKKKTKQLKKFIKYLKKKHKKDRKSVKELHEMEMINIDAALQKRLDEIRAMNKEYISNSTFRDIIVNGTINRKDLRMLMRSHPELNDLVDARRSAKKTDRKAFDVELGFLYY
ncbi:uncharacterized protein LOC126977341 [Leptidea sinapis]|uniref:uncharacterized protein LOC126977341 n=1 Tax=Leptidea sinapis TaxID=189913 RepID=UPI0021244155|nr:uncharacterized protein LOC126977341 [Leptidea sinapis]